MAQVAALKLGGSAPARLVWPAVVAREIEARTSEPRRHWNVTAPRSVVAGLPAGGISWKLHPAWCAERADPTFTNPEAAPPPRSTQRTGAPARRYCRRKRMNSASRALLSPGIEPRMPTVSGWSAGLQTSMVAHRAGERRSERGATADSARVRAPAVAALTGEIRASASRHPSRRLLWCIALTIAPRGGAHAGCARAVICLPDGRHALSGDGRAARRRARLLDARAGRPGTDCAARRSARFRARRGGLPGGRLQRHLLRRQRRTRARYPQPPRRTHDHARDLRPRRHLRGAGAVRGRAALGDGGSDRAHERAGRARAGHAQADDRT